MTEDLSAPSGDVRHLKRIAAQGWPYAWMIAVSALAAAGNGALMAFLLAKLGPFISFIGKAGGGGDEARQAVDGLTSIGWWLIALAAPAAFTAWLAWYAGQWVANRTMADVRNLVLAHLVRLEIAFHHQLNRGDLLTRLTTDLTSTLRVQQYLYGRLLLRPLEMLGIIAFVAWTDWRLGLALLAILAPTVAILVPVVGRTRQRSKQARKTLAQNFSVLEQITAGIRVVKAMGSAEREASRYQGWNRKLYNDNMRLARARAQSDAITAASMFALGGGVMLASGWLFARGQITLTTAVLAIGALARVLFCLRETVRTWGDMQEQLPSVERVYAILDRPSAIPDDPAATTCPVPRQAIRLEGVRFRYDPAAEEVLRGVDLEIPVGRTTALVGRSGGGKSTILDLVARFHDPTAGRVAWDGVEARGHRLSTLAAHLAIVGQDSFLFDDTVYGNIVYGRPGATRAEVEEAARRAHLHDDILRLEGGLGYDTPVGDRGCRLSGGQRQRVAIARAFLRDAPVLLLDEPTSALDAASEAAVQEALRELMRGRTVVIIAHRLATVQHADRIYVLAGKGEEGQGTVVEQGTHAELVAHGGLYAAMARGQSLD